MEREVNLSEKFIIGFWGKFIPLQGVPYIIQAAKFLEFDSKIQFEIIGNGQTSKEVMDLSRELKSRNINFIDFVPFTDLPKKINNYDICLGIFGKTAKTQRVIPNKVFEAVASAKPVITSETPAIKELFTDKKNIMLCQAANAQSLADKIILLKNNKVLRESISNEGYKLFNQSCLPQVIAKQLLKDLLAT